MKRILLLILGLVPLGIGLLQNWLMPMFYDSAAIIWVIRICGVVMLTVWFFISYFCGGWCRRWAWSTALLCIPSAAALVLLGVQVLGRGAYFAGFLGLCTQMFYLPLLGFGYTLTSWSSSMMPAYSAGFLLLVAASVLGCLVRRTRVSAAA